MSSSRRRHTTMRFVILTLSSLLFLNWGLPAFSAAGKDGAGEWLARMVEARTSESYRGTFVYSRGREMSSMKVIHRFSGGQEEERLIALDGEQREILRLGEKVICIFPGGEQVELEQALPGGPFSSAVTGKVMPMESVYSVSEAGIERVAGHAVVKVAVMARDPYRYSYLLWLEQRTGLLVKSLLTDAEGKVLESFQFTDLEITDKLPDELFDPQVELKADNTHSLQTTPEKPIALQWKPDWLPEGFAPAPYVTKTNKVMPESSRIRIYTDGLALFTVFVEPMADADMPEGASRMGATSAYTRYLDVGEQRYVVTVVGEVPIETARKVAESTRPLMPGNS